MPLAFVVALAVMLGSLFTFPWDSDASFLVHDGLHYARNAELDPWGTLIGHHPGFHVLVNVATATLNTMGVERPGHMAVRIISGLGAAAIVLLLAIIAGRERRMTGILLSLPLIATRSFILEAGTGENVLPACAAALLALWAACRPRPRLITVGAAMTLALFMRQDNISLVPACALLFAFGRPPGERLRSAMLLVGGAGVATILLYVFTWRISDPERSFVGYLLYFAPLAPFGGPHAGVNHPVAAHLAVCGATISGEQWFGQIAPHLAVAGGFFVAVGSSAWLLRGREYGYRLGLGTLLVLGFRIPFYAWFEPLNPEWWLVPLVLLSGAAAALAPGIPVRRGGAHVLAVAIILAGATAVLVAHLPRTAELRDRTLAEARDLALELGAGRQCNYVAYEPNAQMALVLEHIPSVELRPPVEEAIRGLALRLEASPQPTVLLLDRFIRTGMPWESRSDFDPLSIYVDGLKQPPGARVLRRKGRVVVIAWNVD